MDTRYILFAVLFIICTKVGAADSIEFDFSKYQVEAMNPTKSAVLAFVKKGWDIQNISANSVTGSINSESVFAEIDYSQLSNIQISYKDGSGSSIGWLLNLKREMLASMLSCE